MSSFVDAERPPGPSTPVRLKKRQLAAVVAGNALEFYDFGVFAYFAVYIAHAFYPNSDPGLSLMASLATYGAGFVTRPLGAFVIGRLGDRVGRRTAMLVSFGLMGVATGGMALTPSYESIGVAAPILVVLFRLLQGFSVGGEVGPSTSFLIESAPAEQRGFYISFQHFGQVAAALSAALVGLVLTQTLSEQAMHEFGWRIGLAVGVLIVPIGLMLRRELTETLHAPEDAGPPDQAQKPPTLFTAFLALVMLSAATTVSHVLGYLTTYSIATLGMPAKTAFTATAAAGVVGVFLPLVGGWLSDRYGRKPVMIVPWVIMLLVVFPCFHWVTETRTLPVLVASMLIMGVGGLSGIAILTSVTEALPKRVRSTNLSMIYALAISIFGGTAQFNVALLERVLHSPLAPAWYMIIGVSIGLLAMLAMPETAPHLARKRAKRHRSTAGATT